MPTNDDAAVAPIGTDVAQLASTPQTISVSASSESASAADPELLLRQGAAFNRERRFA